MKSNITTIDDPEVTLSKIESNSKLRKTIQKLSEKFRQEHIARNSYDYNTVYDSNNRNALSDGDEKGKGENNGSVGSSVDIQNRIENLGRNRYSNNNEYSSINRDAISDGDEYGKGDNNGQVGSLTDINIRVDNIARNPYNDQRRYPDF